MAEVWAQLAAPFPRDALTWRVVELSEDGLRARVEPHVRAPALVARLDEVLTMSGWSNTYAPVGVHALLCTLTIMDVTKSVVVALPAGSEGAARGESAGTRADDALARAAERFGMRPPVSAEASYWVDYDPEAGEPLYEPEAVGASLSDVQPSSQPDALPDSQPDFPQTSQPARPAQVPVQPAQEKVQAPQPPAPPAKSAGQQAIDRLVDRLKEEGRGLEAAKLLTAYKGYGGDPGEARELYAKLRALLLGDGAPS